MSDVCTPRPCRKPITSHIMVSLSVQYNTAINHLHLNRHHHHQFLAPHDSLLARDVQLTSSAHCQVLSKNGQAIGPKNLGVKVVFRFCEVQEKIIHIHCLKGPMMAGCHMPNASIKSIV